MVLMFFIDRLSIAHSDDESQANKRENTANNYHCVVKVTGCRPYDLVFEKTLS